MACAMQHEHPAVSDARHKEHSWRLASTAGPSLAMLGTLDKVARMRPTQGRAEPSAASRCQCLLRETPPSAQQVYNNCARGFACTCSLGNSGRGVNLLLQIARAHTMPAMKTARGRKDAGNVKQNARQPKVLLRAPGQRDSQQAAPCGARFCDNVVHSRYWKVQNLHANPSDMKHAASQKRADFQAIGSLAAHAAWNDWGCK